MRGRLPVRRLGQASLLVTLGILLTLAVAAPAAAQSCGAPPQGFGSAWWRQYARWCECMGGVPNADTISCNGAGRSGGGGPRCDPGWVLMSNGGCMPPGATECGSGGTAIPDSGAVP